jgi:hypothetical protein
VLFIIHNNITNSIKIQPKYFSRVASTMTSTRDKIDTEWANSSVGLPVRIPDNWWVGYTGTNLHDGKIVSFDRVNKKWNLLLDDEDDDDVYLIACDSVCEYANKQHSTFNQYQLPYHPVLVGDDEIETEDGTLYSLTPTDEWTQVDEDGSGRTINPIEWTGGSEEFSVNITDEEVNMMMRRSGTRRYLNGACLDLVMMIEVYLSFKL